MIRKKGYMPQIFEKHQKTNKVYIHLNQVEIEYNEINYIAELNFSRANILLDVYHIQRVTIYILRF